MRHVVDDSLPQQRLQARAVVLVRPAELDADARVLRFEVALELLEYLVENLRLAVLHHDLDGLRRGDAGRKRRDGGGNSKPLEESAHLVPLCAPTDMAARSDRRGTRPADGSRKPR